MCVLFAGIQYEISIDHMKNTSDIPPRNELYLWCVQLHVVILCLRSDKTRAQHPACRVRSSTVSDARDCIASSVTMMVGVGGTVLVADAKRCTVTLRLLMRPYPVDNDCEAIAVELVSRNSDGDGEGKGEVRSDSGRVS
jgi:hypothetical protein